MKHIDTKLQINGQKLFRKYRDFDIFS